MVVYADVLIFLNTVVNFLIISASKIFSKADGGILRRVFAALVGGLLSLYIFLPQQNFIIEISFKLLSGVLLSVIAFKISSLKMFLRAVISQFAVSFVYVGFMIAFFYIFNPKGMAINNGIVYFAVSPLVIIISSAVCYLALIFIPRIFKREDASSKSAEIIFYNNGVTVTCTCMVDTGCTLCDTFLNNKVALIDKKTAYALFSFDTVENILKLKSDALSEKIRLIPYKTIASGGVMPAIKIDYAIYNSKKLNSVLLCISDSVFDGDFSGIISPDFLT